MFGNADVGVVGAALAGDRLVFWARRAESCVHFFLWAQPCNKRVCRQLRQCGEAGRERICIDE